MMFLLGAIGAPLVSRRQKISFLRSFSYQRHPKPNTGCTPSPAPTLAPQCERSDELGVGSFAASLRRRETSLALTKRGSVPCLGWASAGARLRAHTAHLSSSLSFSTGAGGRKVRKRLGREVHPVECPVTLTLTRRPRRKRFGETDAALYLRGMCLCEL